VAHSEPPWGPLGGRKGSGHGGSDTRAQVDGFSLGNLAANLRLSRGGMAGRACESGGRLTAGQRPSLRVHYTCA
jgi:hypothetical protein